MGQQWVYVFIDPLIQYELVNTNRQYSDLPVSTLDGKSNGKWQWQWARIQKYLRNTKKTP